MTFTFLYRNTSTIFLKSICSIFLFFFITTTAFSQLTKQRVEGNVTDENKTPLIGASIFILNTNPIIGTATDESGDFVMLNVPHGNYEVEVSYVGYNKKVIQNVDVNFNKFTRIEVALERNIALEEVVVIPNNPAKLRSSSLQVLTIEETLRYPATFNDPARLAVAHAGVLNSNDQANNLIVRGNAPNGLSWYLEGVEIVNPNHLSNAGTQSDRITKSGGGVNILSAQLMKKADFYSGAFPTSYGNVLGGIMDVDVRKGKYDRHHQTAQIGLLGIDVSAEGPAAKDNDDAYLINYRYSTIGLLSQLGVELGDEIIDFQDLAFNIVLPSRTIGTISLFGMGGISNNVFEAKRDTSLWEFQKDSNDITYKNKMGAIGLAHNWDMQDGNKLSTTVVFSGLDANRSGTSLTDSFEEIFTSEDEIMENKLSIHSFYKSKISDNQSITGGLRLTIIGTKFRYQFSPVEENFGDFSQNILQPYINYKINITNRLEMNAGIHYLNYQLANANLFEPRIYTKYYLTAQSNISLSYGLNSSLQPPELFFNSASPIYSNESLLPTRAHHFVLGYQHFLNSYTMLSIESYYQKLFDVPVDENIQSSFSALNMLEEPRLTKLKNDGTGTNYGVEISLKRFLTNELFYLLNTSVYESKYVGSDGIERDTRFNGNYIANLTIGKEFIKIKSANEETKRRIFGLNIRGIYAGGLKVTPIDEAISSQNGETVYQNNKAFSIKQKDFFKIDLRIYRTVVRNKFKSTLALDLQNATNHRNSAYSYYDTFQEKVLEKYQLGFIPNLSYRIEL